MQRNKPIFLGLAFMLFLFFGEVSMGAQKGTLSLKMDNVTVKQVLDAIEGQTDVCIDEAVLFSLCQGRHTVSMAR